jgi:hypothetical protein
MNLTPEQSEAYNQLKAISNDVDFVTGSTEQMSSAAAAQFEAQVKAVAALDSASAPVYEGLRTAFRAIPGVASALKVTKRSEPITLSVLNPIHVQSDPIVRLGSTHIIEHAPFKTPHIRSHPDRTGNWDSTDTIFSLTAQADPTGTMSLVNQPISGTAHCWTALGKPYKTPKAGVLRFEATPSFSWRCDWSSDWWRLAMGKVYIGLDIHRFLHNGTYIDTPVSFRHDLYSYNDNNLSDRGDQSGQSTGYHLSSGSVPCDASVTLTCWVVIGCVSNASEPDSAASNSMSANLGTVSFDYWT